MHMQQVETMRRRIGPYSREHKIARIDGRRREAKFIRDYREALIRHIGGQPSFVELALIDRAARLALRIDLLDRRLAEGKSLTIRDQNYYVAWGNSLARSLSALGRRPRGEVRVVSHGQQPDALMCEDVLGAFVPEEDDLAPLPPKKEAKPKPRLVIKKPDGTRDIAAELLGDNGKRKISAAEAAYADLMSPSKSKRRNIK